METTRRSRNGDLVSRCRRGGPSHIRRSSLRLPLPLRREPKALLCQGGRRRARNESTPPDPRLRTLPKWPLGDAVDDAEGRGDTSYPQAQVPPENGPLREHGGPAGPPLAVRTGRQANATALRTGRPAGQGRHPGPCPAGSPAHGPAGGGLPSGPPTRPGLSVWPLCIAGVRQ